MSLNHLFCLKKIEINNNRYGQYKNPYIQLYPYYKWIKLSI